MIPDTEIRLATTQAELDQAYAVRTEVFVHEQNVPLDLERDELDAEADHFLALSGGVPTGAGRLVVLEDTGLLGRLAVLKQARGTGLGVIIAKAVEERAAQRGLAVVELHAQIQARGFYERLGYSAVGDEYMEAGIAHISMRKSLADR